MEELYLIRWGNLYLQGFCLNGSSRWVIDLDQAVWISLDRANKLVNTIAILEDISVEVELV